MSTVVYASDLHGNRDAYDRLFSLDADAVLLGGDLLPYPLKSGGDLLALQRRFVSDYLAAKMATRRTASSSHAMSFCWPLGS